MTIIKHRFLEHKINPNTETLIVGTFNPDAADNEAEFFYGRERNFLWRLITTAIGYENLKGKTKKEKLDFIQQNKIDFIDLISEVNVEEGEETNYEDRYIDDKVTEWRKVVDEIKKLNSIKRVAFTRKTLTDIPQMKIRVEEIEKYCKVKQIPFHFLKTPARTYSASKQKLWTDFFTNDN
jgi:G:T/U-mismatch repair DNA glycosylase